MAYNLRKMLFFATGGQKTPKNGCFLMTKSDHHPHKRSLFYIFMGFLSPKWSIFRFCIIRSTGKE